MKSSNPFYHRGPIRDSRFFWNRAEEVAQARLLPSRGQSVSIVGPRRIGKSSLLFHLDAVNRAQAGADRYCYFNCEGWSGAAPPSLYAVMLQAMNGEAVAASLEDTGALDYRRFREGVLDAVPDAGRLVVMLDEFESFAANAQLDAGFFSGLRALASTDRVVFITASARSLGWLTFAEPTALSSPFFNIFTQINLRLFTWEEAVAMLGHFSAEAERPFAADTIRFVLDLAGPHPFFLQIGAFYAFDAVDPAGGALTDDAKEQVRHQFLEQAETYWQHVWSELQPVDRKQLAYSTDLTTCSANLVRHLRDLALIVDEPLADAPASPRLLSPEFEAFLSCQPVEGLLQAPPLVIDESQHRVTLAGRPLDVSNLEYKLLRLLVDKAGGVVTQEEIFQTLWPQDDPHIGNIERLKSVVRALRRRLGGHSHLVKNERGVGYTLRAERLDR